MSDMCEWVCGVCRFNIMSDASFYLCERCGRFCTRIDEKRHVLSRNNGRYVMPGGSS